MDTDEEVRRARRETCVAIADYAAKKHQLEGLRKDRDADPNKIMDAAQAFRTAETLVHDMIEKEVVVITKVVILRATGTASPEGDLPTE